MICLDTNYLILSLVPGSREAARLEAWAGQGETFVTPAVAWFEFLCGPVQEPEVATMRALLQEVVPFDEAQAREAARLFNACGRKRPLRVDAMIAAAAISRNAALATGDTDDFGAFIASGLRLVA